MTHASTARPDESVVSLSEMLGTRGVAVSSRVGRAPNARTGLAAGALLLREGYQGLSIGGVDGPRHYRPDAIVRVREPEEVAASVDPAEPATRSGARLRLATATGAVVALGSLVGASTMNGSSSPTPVSAAVHELGNVYAGYAVLSGPEDASAVARTRSRSAAGSLSPLRGSPSTDRSDVPGLTARWAHPGPVSDVRFDSHARRAASPGGIAHAEVLAAPDGRQRDSGWSHTVTAPDASQRETPTKKRWPLSRSSPSKKSDPAVTDPSAKAGNAAALDKTTRSDSKTGSNAKTGSSKTGSNDTASSDDTAGSDKPSRLGKTTRSGKSSTSDGHEKSSKPDRSGDRSISKRHSSNDSAGSGKRSLSSGKSGSHGGGSHGGGSDGGGHSSGEGGGGGHSSGKGGGGGSY